ncbi:MAG: ferritin-like domain-containing protein [Candidatus Brocadiia bacterium]
MGTRFNADEIFEMAERIERNGRRFYLAAAENTDNEELERMFRELAEIESEHEELFHKKRKELSDKEAPDGGYDPDWDVPRYLDSLADTKVFKVHEDVSEELNGDESPEEILQMAIQAEKDSVVFYLGIKDSVAEAMGQDKVEWLIDQEMSHIDELRSLFQKLV